MRLKTLVLVVFFLCTSFWAHVAQGSLEPADYVFVNGKIYTVNPQQPWAEAVAVKDKRIVYVGSGNDAKKWIGPESKVVDLTGRMLMPGFVDGHNHFVCGATAKRGIRLVGSENRAEMLQRIRDYVGAHPTQEVYLGYGWTFSMFGGRDGTRQELDAFSRDKPIVLFNEDTHCVWFNTKAMEMAGITKSTPDMANGSSYLSREPDGTPAGFAVEPEVWMGIALATGIAGGKETLRAVMEEVFPLAPKAGITAYHDMGIFAPELSQGYLGFELLREWEQAGKLPCRVVGVYGMRDAKAPPADHVAKLKEWSEKYRSELVQVTGLKIWADGAYATHTGVMLEPYADKPDTKGESDWTVEVLTGWIDAAYAAGFDVHIHTIGDGSLRRSLDAFEAVEKKRDCTGRRSALHHINVIHPDDLPRFKSLRIGANATLEWLVTYWDDALRVLGKERTEKENDIWKNLIDMGVNVSFGSDIPGTDPNELPPLYQMQVALTRRVPGLTFTSTPSLDRIPSLEQMLRGYTIAGAYQMHMEDKIGSIEEGKLADLIVLEQNLFDAPVDQLSTVKIPLTMMNGKITHIDSSSDLSMIRWK
jgi:predicted amidohydrolase YtcJ